MPVLQPQYHGINFVSIDLPYADVSPYDWCYDAVRFTYDRGIMTGFNETTFGPNESMARDHLVTILYRLEGEPAISYEPIFSDVPDNAYFTNAVLWAKQVGITTGYQDTNEFGVGVLITREQFVTMLYRYAQYKGLDTSQKTSIGNYEDGNQVSTFSKEAMEWALGCGIIKGQNNQPVIDPQGQTGRAAGATMIMRFMEYYSL